jgi:hypothetical protein
MSGSLLLYTNHLPSTQMYPYGEPADVVSLPPLAHGVLFDNILSSFLPLGERRLKYFALDAMNDLRLTDSYYQYPPSLALAVKPLLHALKVELTGSDDSYYRRALRPNELFFEIHAASLYEPGVAQALERPP